MKKRKRKNKKRALIDFENVSLRTAYRRINEFCEMNQEKLIIGRREIRIKLVETCNSN